MNIDQDKLPNNLNEAVEMLMASLTDEDRKEIDELIKIDPDLTSTHHGLGQYLRNNWNLWVDSPIARWFISEHRICHADDMSGIILEAFSARYLGKPYDPVPSVKHFHEHWRKSYKRYDAPEIMIEQWKERFRNSQ